MIKVDLHTHSTTSPDGGISLDEYVETIGNKDLDYIAVTDHGSIEFAKKLKKALGDKIIVGQEIDCLEGEIIGLYLSEKVQAGLPVTEAVKVVKKQGGLVYVPHPFETVRKGLTKGALESIKELVDIVEVYNGRALVQNKGPEASVWARVNEKATSASSDAHGVKGLATAYNILDSEPTVRSLVQQLKTGKMNMQRPPAHTLLYPKINRLRQKIHKRLAR